MIFGWEWTILRLMNKYLNYVVWFIILTYIMRIYEETV